jgi:undecaprenyl pyrophosphate phosphatase UppP
VKRFLSSGLVRGLALVAVVSAVIVALQAQWSLRVVGAILWIVFLVALGFVLVRLYRERRGEADHWTQRGRVTFVAAIAVGVADVVAALLLGPTRGDAVIFFVVLGCAVYAALRVWRDEQRLV